MPQQLTILQKIVQDKAFWLAEKQQAFPLEQFQADVKPSDRSFYQALGQGSHERPAFILECKKASPSKGLIRAEFDLASIANVYRHYASVISVLTDEKYFQGNFAYIAQVREQVSQPILCKDFMISPYQVYLARYHQADAILLMLSVVDDETYTTLRDLAHSLNMGVLTETSNEQEFERALRLGAKVIGVNNRNLHDLSIDLQRTERLIRTFADRIPADVCLISESGISDHRLVQQIKPYAHGFLIGSSLMGSPDLNNAVRSIMFGENKVCGLTRSQDVQAVYQAGALYGGLIFAEGSPRQLSLRQAQELVVAAPLRFVGVFQNQAVDFVAKIAKQLELFAVQLHGSETADYVTELATLLDGKTEIWQAVGADKLNDVQPNPQVSRYVLDNVKGGSGQAFDWSQIPAWIKPKALLAGGINLDNLDLALQQGCLGLDLNSGVEASKGVKESEKVQTAFARILSA